MKATVVHWGTVSALYTGPGSFGVYLLHANKKFQVRIETGGKPIWSEYFSRLPEATEWAYQNAKEGIVTTEDLIKKYNICPEDAKELWDFSVFLKQRKREKQEQVFSECSVQTIHPVFTMGKGHVYKLPGTEHTRTMYKWVIEGNNGRLHISGRDTDDQSKAEAQLRKVLEVLE